MENQEQQNEALIGGSGLNDELAEAKENGNRYKSALEEIWTKYINAGEYVISAGTLAYIAKDVLEANVKLTGSALLRSPA